jgi:hypothetical protein
LLASAGIAYYDRASVASASTAVVVAVISVWTIVASLVFSPTTAQHLALASSLAISGLALVGLTTHELSHRRAVQPVEDSSSETDIKREARLASAA